MMFEPPNMDDIFLGLEDMFPFWSSVSEVPSTMINSNQLGGDVDFMLSNL